MRLLRAARATKVLLLAFALAMPVGLPAETVAAEGFSEAQTRVRHVRLKHRLPHHAFRKRHHGARFFAAHRRHRSVLRGIDDFPSFVSGGLPDVSTRTRHVRLKHRSRHFARRGWNGGSLIVIDAGGHGFDGDSGYLGYGLPSPVSGIGTYAGNLSAFREEGNGIFFSREDGYGYFPGESSGAAPSKRAKIIIVSPQTNASACAWEHGVCIVRP